MNGKIIQMKDRMPEPGKERKQKEPVEPVKNRPGLVWLFIPLCCILLSAAAVWMKYQIAPSAVEPWILSSSWRRQLLHTFVGIAVMFIVGSMDFRKPRKYSWLMAIVLTVVVALLISSGANVYGFLRISGMAVTSFHNLALLGIPLYAMLLMNWQGKSSVVMRAFVGAALLLIPAFLLRSVPDIMYLTFTFLVMFDVAAFCGWYGEKPGKYLIIQGLLAAAWIILILVVCLNPAVFDNALTGYRFARIQEFLGNRTGYNYYDLFHEQVTKVMNLCAPLGTSMEAVKEGSVSMLRVGNEYSFVAMSTIYGYVGAAVLVGLLPAAVLVCMVRSRRYRNGFSKVLLCGAGTVLAVQTIFSVAVQLGWVPITRESIPFVTAATSQVICFFFAGLMLSADKYRNAPEEEITMEKKKKSSIWDLILMDEDEDDDEYDLDDDYKELIYDKELRRLFLEEEKKEKEIISIPLGKFSLKLTRKQDADGEDGEEPEE